VSAALSAEKAELRKEKRGKARNLHRRGAAPCGALRQGQRDRRQDERRYGAVMSTGFDAGVEKKKPEEATMEVADEA
jgi:hypothetical protein